MKKFITNIIAVVLCSFLLISCSASNKEADNNGVNEQSTGSDNNFEANVKSNGKAPINITLWHYYTGESQSLLESLVAEFNQTKGLDEGIIVNPVAKGKIAELEESVTNSAKGVINSEPMPDIFSCYADKALELSTLDALCDLNNYYNESERADFIPQFLSDGIIGESLYVIPIAKSTEVFYINNTELTNLSENASDLNTWENIFKTAKNYYEITDAKTPGKDWDGKSFMGFDSVANYIIVSSKQFGIDIIDGKNDCVNLKKDVLKKIFDNYYLGFSLGYYGEEGKFRSDGVKTGDLVAYVGASSGAGYFPDWVENNGQKVDIELVASNYPSFVDNSALTIQQGAGMAVAKGDSSKEQASVIFLKWFTEVSQNIKFATESGYLPVKTAAYSKDSITEILNSIDNENIKKLYELSTQQVIENNTYASIPFDGSYDFRKLLQSSLMDIAQSGKGVADELKQKNASEQEIIEALDSSSKFNEWIDTLTEELNNKKIKYVLN